MEERGTQAARQPQFAVSGLCRPACASRTSTAGSMSMVWYPNAVTQYPALSRSATGDPSAALKGIGVRALAASGVSSPSGSRTSSAKCSFSPWSSRLVSGGSSRIEPSDCSAGEGVHASHSHENKSQRSRPDAPQTRSSQLSSNAICMVQMPERTSTRAFTWNDGRNMQQI
eukprot:1335125-Pleurochrysis_carterae.AAC.2